MKRKLTLKKEVVTSLNANQVTGGYNTLNRCPSDGCVHPMSYNQTECGDSICICLVTEKFCATHDKCINLSDINQCIQLTELQCGNDTDFCLVIK